MTIGELADTVNEELEIIRFPQQEGRFMAHFPNMEIKDKLDSIMLAGSFGNGKTPTEAINDYISQIRSKWGIFNAGGAEKRKEIFIPNTLESFKE